MPHDYWRYLSRPLPHATEAPAHARHLLRDVCEKWQLTALQGVVELLVSEVVTNAVRHGEAPVQLWLAVHAHGLACAVADGDPQPPRMRTTSVDEESGRGLQLLTELADTWGSYPSSRDKLVWFTSELPGPE